MCIAHTAARSTFVSAAAFLIHGGPSASLRLIFRNTAGLIAFLDVLRFAFLFVGVFRFVSARHGISPVLGLGVSIGERRNALRVPVARRARNRSCHKIVYIGSSSPRRSP